MQYLKQTNTFFCIIIVADCSFILILDSKYELSCSILYSLMMCSTDWWVSWVHTSLKAAPHSTLYGLLSMQQSYPYSALHCTAMNCTAECCTVFHCTMLLWSALHSDALFCTVQCCTGLFWAILHFIVLCTCKAALQYTKVDCSDVQYMFATFIVPIGVSEWI